MLEHRNAVMKKFSEMSKQFLNQPRLQKNFEVFSKSRRTLLEELVQVCQMAKSLSKTQMGMYEGFEKEQLKNVFQKSDLLWHDIYHSEERIVSLLEEKEANDAQPLEKKLA